MTDDEGERYVSFQKEITSRSFGFRGARQRILGRLEPLAPKALDLKGHRTALLEAGLESPELSADFRHKFLDTVAFLCCLSRQASDLKWKADQIRKWKALGLNVEEELAKRSFETPVPVVPPKEGPPPEAPPEARAPEGPPAEEQPPPPTPAPEPEAPQEEVVPSELDMVMVDAQIVLPSGKSFTLRFDPEESSVHLTMRYPLDKCKLEDVQNELLKQEQSIEGLVLQKAKASDIEEAKNIQELTLSVLQIEGDLPSLALLAKQGKTARFHVTGKQSHCCYGYIQSISQLDMYTSTRRTHVKAMRLSLLPTCMLASGVCASAVKAKMTEEQQIPPVVPIPVEKEQAPPQEEEAQPETPEEQTPPPEPEQKEVPREEEKPPMAPQPRTVRGRQTPEKCKHFPLNLDLSPKDIRQQTLTHLVDLLNEATAETDSSQVSAACLTWAANVEIYERLHMATRRRWTAPEVIEGAPTPSHWLAVRLQTAIDVKDIKGTKETIKDVTRCTRICIDAVRVMGSLMNKKRLDKPDAPMAGPASALATALNVSLDAGDALPALITNFSVAKCSTEKAAVKANLWSLSLAIFMSALSWYHVGVECLVQIKQEHRHLLAYLALPDDSVIDSFLSFVEQYNSILTAYKPQSSKAKSTVAKAAKNCQPILLSKEKTNMPEAVGEANLDRKL
ncbi:hypothetical protein ACSSS7_000966 [Eimeria intestinalis]